MINISNSNHSNKMVVTRSLSRSPDWGKKRKSAEAEVEIADQAETSTRTKRAR